MRHRQGPSVEQRALARDSGDRARTVNGVVRDRRPGVGAVRADLVRPPRVQVHRRDREPRRGVVSVHVHRRARGEPRAGVHLRAAGGPAAERRLRSEVNNSQ